MITTKKIYSVSQVSNGFKALIERQAEFRSIYISGEVTNYSQASSGHIYFALKEDNTLINAAIFKGSVANCPRNMKNGDQIVVHGRLSWYEGQGRVQIIVDSAELAGAGRLMQLFEQLKKELEKEGFFDKEHKKAIPPYAMRIGIVTSDQGAVIRDIQKVKDNKNPYVSLFLYPTPVQGEKAGAMIAKGIQVLDKLDFDIIIVARGGGSLEDLWSFNERCVAEAIYHCKTPIISAVGHEVDYTIADLVADARAGTPTAAAQMAVFSYDDYKRLINHKKDFLTQRMSYQLEKSNLQLLRLKNEIEKKKPERLIHSQFVRLISLKSKLNESIQREIEWVEGELFDYQTKLPYDMDEKMNRITQRFQVACKHLEGVSPLARIGNGYLYTVDEKQKTVKSVVQLKKGETVKSYLADGTMIAEVKEVNRYEK